MTTIRQVLDENIDVVNELINAAFREGYSTPDMPDAVAEAIREFAEKAIYARTRAYKLMSDIDPPAPFNKD